MNTLIDRKKYKKEYPVSFRPLDLEKDAPMLLEWVTSPHAQYWGMLESNLEQVKTVYQQLLDAADYKIYVGEVCQEPTFLMESYNPKEDAIGGHYEVQEGDRGMHVLIKAPKQQVIPGFTWHVFTSIMDFLFQDEAHKRIVVEPDVNNDKIHVLNKRAGFVYQKEVMLPSKKAFLAFCSQEQYTQAINNWAKSNPVQTWKHLNSESWAIVNRKQIKKAIAEFAHERLIVPELLPRETHWYQIKGDDANICYYFEARVLMLNHWSIEDASIQKTVRGEPAALSLLEFIQEFKIQLGLSEEILPTYLEEITSTLFSQAYKHCHHSVDAQELVGASFQQIERAMLEGHPCFVANSGRIGFSGADFKKYAPEAQHPFSVVWLAGDKKWTHYAGIDTLSYEQLLEQELGKSKRLAFEQKLKTLNLDPDNFVFFPVHPWQWENKVLIVFAADLATQKLIYLGESQDRYAAQQSIRTLYNADQPQKFYTKTALSIINMGFMRGLSPYYMKVTPAITTWINKLLEGDAYLEDCGFQMLGEVATVGYTNAPYDHLGASCAYNKMLSALWRESPMAKKKSNQQVMTMAAFLHIDHQGEALLPLIIQRSGASIEQWLKAYLKSYLSPLLHCFFKHELVFMPHGENVIMILENHLPTGMFMKDITEEILVYNKEIVVPKNVQRVLVEATDEMKILSVFTDVFDCYFRFMSAILNDQADFPEALFWRTVAHCVLEYQEQHPEFKAKYERYDLFVPEFKLCCLNRLQLGNNKQMLDLADPINSLKFSGMLSNPITHYKQQSVLVE